MTTIAWDGRFLVSDSQSTNSNDTITSIECKKIFTPKNGEVWCVNNKNVIAMAYCGMGGTDIELIDKMLKGIRHDTEYTSVSQFTAICICDDNSTINIYKNEKDSQALLYACTGCHALGIGAQYALTAMRMGYSAVKAVEIAITLDIYSGGEIQIFEIMQ